MATDKQTHDNDQDKVKRRSPQQENVNPAPQQQPLGAMSVQQARLDPRSLSAMQVLQLQRTVGNQALLQMSSKQKTAPESIISTQNHDTIQCVSVGVWNGENIKLNNKDHIRRIIEQIQRLLAEDNHIVLTITEILDTRGGEEFAAYLRQHLRGSGDWYVKAVYVGTTPQGAREEYNLVVSNFRTKSKRQSLPRDRDNPLRSASVTSWRSRMGRKIKVAAYHAFGPRNDHRGSQLTAVRQALEKRGVDVIMGDFNMHRQRYAGYNYPEELGPTTAGGNKYDWILEKKRWRGWSVCPTVRTIW